MIRQIVETVHHAALDDNCISFSKVSRQAVRGAEILAQHAMQTSSDGFLGQHVPFNMPKISPILSMYLGTGVNSLHGYYNNGLKNNKTGRP
ncbi:hypothetical protein QJS10_CPB14g01136 [Acorus calamus]|uniref:Uncharacterized protein n=1 Tax=Acorus calamus TaxID=4465 RepID=A0AAV9DA57_ACOCL|nr:hypothetical protein QJS10_CPB14g01136 [Acorus calamus]